MATIKLTKMGLRDEQVKLKQLETYLPTIRLKKFLLQLEINNTQTEILHMEDQLQEAKEKVETFANLLDVKYERSPLLFCQILHLEKRYENIAGVEIPTFERVTFRPMPFFLFDTPPWMDLAIHRLRDFITLREMLNVLKEKKRALEIELRDVSIRVNLFEKILIPRIQEEIKKIKIFLGDQELAAISRAKMAKKKIEGDHNR